MKTKCKCGELDYVRFKAVSDKDIYWCKNCGIVIVYSENDELTILIHEKSEHSILNKKECEK